MNRNFMKSTRGHGKLRFSEYNYDEIDEILLKLFSLKRLRVHFLKSSALLCQRAHKCKIFYLAYGKKKLTLIESKSQSKIFQSICMNQLQVIHFLYREYSMYANL